METKSQFKIERLKSREFAASLVYKVSARTARATQINPVSKIKKKKKKVGDGVHSQQ